MSDNAAALGDRSWHRPDVAILGPRLPRLVLLTEIPFWDSTLGSHVRIANLLKALDPVCRLSVLSFRTISAAIQQTYGRLGLRGDLVSYKAHEGVKEHGAFQAKVSKNSVIKPHAQDGWTQASLNYLAEQQPDFVIIEYITRSYLLDAVPQSTRTILDAHDVMSQRALIFARADKRAGIIMSAQQEAELLSRYDAVLAISPSDAEAMRRSLGLRNVVSAPHAVEVAERPSPRNKARRLLFTGGNNEANASGLKWFIDQVWPIVRDGMELHVVGTVGESLPSPRPPGVIVHGVVDHLAAMHAFCDMVVNPVFVGGGIKIKTLEAMGYGLPCVTTREGARGLEAAVGNGLVVARSRLEFAEWVLRLRDDRARREQIARAAQAYVLSHHVPAVAFKDLRLFLSHA